MKKFILKNTKEEIKLGDTFYSQIKEVTEDSVSTTIFSRVLTEELLSKMIKRGEIEVINEKEEIKKANTYEELIGKTMYKEVLTKLAKRTNANIEDLKNNIEFLYAINPSSVYVLILKELAIEFDNYYSDYIGDSEEIYVVSLTDMKVYKMPKEKITSYTNFAAFRTSQDAKLALLIATGGK